MRLILLLLISDAYAYICHANRVVHAFTPAESVPSRVFCDIFTKDTWKPLETRGNYQYEGFHGFPYHGNPWKPGGYLLGEFVQNGLKIFKKFRRMRSQQSTT